METQTAVRVVIAGGGFGGLETALYLRNRLAEAAEVTLVSDREHFLFKPYLTYVPFGLTPEAVQIDLEQLAHAHNLVFRRGRVQGLDPVEKVLDVAGARVPYSYLVVATGATAGPETVPGLASRAYTIWNRGDMKRLHMAYRRLVRDAKAGQRRRVVFLVPPGCGWAGPLYEMVLMLATWLQANDAREAVDLVLSTWETAHLRVLGPEMQATVMQELEKHDVEAHRSWTARRVEDEAVIEADGRRLAFDLLITVPTPAAAVDWRPLPVDAQGFLQTRTATRQVEGYPDVYAVGDASDAPIKQAFLALLQADAAAEHLAARVLEAAPAFGYDPHTIWVMDELDRAVFAQVPLGVGGEAAEVNRVPPGELQRMLLSDRLPRPYGENILYAGLLWKGTQVGLKILKHLLNA